MPAVPVSVSGQDILMILTGRIRSSLLSTGILQNEMMALPATHAFVASPEIVTALAIAGTLLLIR